MTKSFVFNPITKKLDYIDTEDLSGYVPYTGATLDLDLGANDLIINTDCLKTDLDNNRVEINDELYLDGLAFSAPIVGSQLQLDFQAKTGNYVMSASFGPSGNKTKSTFQIRNSSSRTDCGKVLLVCDGATATIRSKTAGTGTPISTFIIGEDSGSSDLDDLDFYLQQTAELRISTTRTYINGDLGVGVNAPDTKCHIDGAITLNEINGDPTKPDDTKAVIWMTDGAGSIGADGDVIIASTVGATTKYTIIHDYSAGTTWV